MILLPNVCCAYCLKFETGECPVKSASPWSRWGNWCNEYERNPEMSAAADVAVVPARGPKLRVTSKNGAA